MADVNYLREEGDSCIFVGNYMEVYIPKYYFERGNATQQGSIIETLGVFSFRVFESEDRQDTAKLHLFNFPSLMSTQPSDTYSKKIVDLVEGQGEMNYTVLKYYKGDKFITNLNVAKQSNNTSSFINLMNDGKLSTAIPYNKILETELANLDFNGVNLQVPATVMELIISEIYRDKADLTRPFRFKAGSSASVSMYDYKPINIKSIATFNSTFTGITFEDLDYNITASVNKARQNKKEAISPIEKTIKY